MKVSRRQLRRILRDLIDREVLTEKITGGKSREARASSSSTSASSKSVTGSSTASVTASSVEASEGVDACWNELGTYSSSHRCNLDAFTARGPRNYRSAKPGANSGTGNVPSDEATLKHLRDKWGIKRVIDLTGDSSEASLVRGLGMDYIASDGGYSKPGDDTWRTMKSWLDQGNTLIHCTYGADRTGGYVGRYKIEKGGDVDTVREEMENNYSMNARPDNERLHDWLDEPCHAGLIDTT